MPAYSPQYNERTGVARITLSNRHFQTDAAICYRGGYLWIKKEDLRCFATLMVGFTEQQALAWMRQSEETTGTPFAVMHYVLFDIPLSANVPAEEDQELRAQWLRATDQGGRVFGVRKLEVFANCFDSAAAIYNASVGMGAVRATVAEKEEIVQWPAKAERIRCRYLSGLEPDEGPDFGKDSECDIPWDSDWADEL